MNPRVMYMLVEWEISDDYVDYLPQYSLVPVDNLLDVAGELHTGKLVAVTWNGVDRRAKVIMISGSYQYLQEQLIKLEESNLQQVISARHESMTPSLDVTIQKLKHMLEQRKSPESGTSGRPSPIAQFLTQEAMQNFNQMHQNQRASTSRLSPDFTTIGKMHSFRENNIRHPSKGAMTPSSTYSYDQSILSEIRQLKEDLSEAQMQYLEVNYYMDSLKDRVDSMNERIEKWTISDIETNHSYIEDGTDIPLMDEDNDEEYVTPKPSRQKKRKPSVSPRKGLEDCEDPDDMMVSIGTGGTSVPQHVMNQIDWRSHTIATRKLLMALFPRKILATHSLTGKSSPAFTNKPAKLCLDPLRVRDIVITVSERCGVNPSLVRSAITTKCADENKMFRTREAKKRDNKKKTVENQENIPPRQKADNDLKNESQSTSNTTMEK